MWYPHKKGPFEHRDRHTQRDDVKTQGEHQLQTKEHVKQPEVRREA